MGEGRTLYDVIGAAPTASAEELRRAYRDRARRLHPDRHVDAGPPARAAAERDMQELTAAWQVLSDAGRRHRYDRELGLARVGARVEDQSRFEMRADGTVAHGGDEIIDPTARLVRALPWIAILFVLGIIFVFSAYALTGGPKEPLPGKVGQCISVGAAGDVSDVPCGTPHSRTIVTLVGPSSQCPIGTERLQPRSGTAVYCLRSAR